MTLFLPIVTMFRNVALFLIVNGVFFRWKLAFMGNVGTDKRKLSSAKLLIQAGRILYAAKNTPFHPIPDLGLLSVYLFSVPICGHPYVTSVGTQSRYVVSVGLVGKWHSMCRVWGWAGFYFSQFSVRECEKQHVPRAKTRSSNIILFALARKHYCLEPDKCQGIHL